MDSSANILLAIGASPVMAHCLGEVEEMTSLADALVLNIGTLQDDWIDSMILAAKTANTKGIPVILDPVGSGATSLRTKAVKKINECGKHFGTQRKCIRNILSCISRCPDPGG